MHVNLIPQEIYKYTSDGPLKPLDLSPPSHNCLSEVTGAERDHSKMHQSTPLLRATLCRRGECVPDIHNTVLFGIIHIKYTEVRPRQHPATRVRTLKLTPTLHSHTCSMSAAS